jgi:glycosyltransferase involved in cell wall biosynthesis
MKYVVVLPAKNEQQNIRGAIESIVNQTIPPRLVLVLDDCSDDGTLDIVRSLEQQYGCLTHHSATSSKNTYELGGHVVRLFREGKQVIDSKGIEYDWLIKMDADLECEPDFIERIEDRIRGVRVGIVSGTPYFDEGGRKIFDTSPAWHTHGQFKIYNAECFEAYGGPREHLGWDCADNVLAISAGWQTIAIRDINYRMHRAVGGKHSVVKGRINHGIGCYLVGFGPGYFMMKVAHDLFKPPLLLGSISLLRGYFRAAIHRYPKVLSKSQRRLLRKLLWSSLWVRLKGMDFVIQQKLLARKQN